MDIMNIDIPKPHSGLEVPKNGQNYLSPVNIGMKWVSIHTDEWGWDKFIN